MCLACHFFLNIKTELSEMEGVEEVTEVRRPTSPPPPPIKYSHKIWKKVRKTHPNIFCILLTEHVTFDGVPFHQ